MVFKSFRKRLPSLSSNPESSPSLAQHARTPSSSGPAGVAYGSKEVTVVTTCPSMPLFDGRKPMSHLRTVILGQHPTRVQALAKLLNDNRCVNVVAGCSYEPDCAAVLKALIPPPDLLVVGAYFEEGTGRDILLEAGNDECMLITVPDGYMMTNGPPAVMTYIQDQLAIMQQLSPPPTPKVDISTVPERSEAPPVPALQV